MDFKTAVSLTVILAIAVLFLWFAIRLVTIVRMRNHGEEFAVKRTFMEQPKRHIVYLVGAGLTKSLEVKPNRIPLMNDFVAVMADYLQDKVIMTTMAEAENAGVFQWSREEWRVLAEEIMQFRNSDQEVPSEPLETFRQILKRRPAENIEKLLQRSFEGRGNLSAELLPQRFNFAINRVFSHIGWGVNWEPLERFLNKQFALEEAMHTFISFNYDLVLDRCVQQQSSGRWCPDSGYGFKVQYFMTPDEGGSRSVLDARELGTTVDGEPNFLVLKPHGSLNWLLRFKGNYEFVDEVPILCLTSDQTIAYYPEFDQRVAFPNELPRNRGLFLMPPTPRKLSKVAFLRDLRRQETDALRSATEIYLMGWSLPVTDRDQERLIRSSVGKRKSTIDKVTVINLGAPAEYFQRVADVFSVGHTQLDVYNSGFSDYVFSL